MKYFLFVLFALAVISSYAQEVKNPFELERKRLYLKLELENRITPYGTQDQIITSGTASDAIFNRDNQSIGLAVGYKLQYLFSKNFSVGFGHTFRNASIIYERSFPEIASSSVSEKALLMDAHLEASYHFKVFKKGQFHITLGRSFMNLGSDYSTTAASFNNEGELIGFISSVQDFKFQPVKVEVGYMINRFEASIGTYYDSETPFSNDVNLTYFPYFKFSYYVLKI